MMDISFIMGFLGVALGLIIGILIFGSVEDVIDCPTAQANPTGNESCEKATGLAWTVIGILPITLFVALFSLFGGMKNLEFA